MDPTDYIELHLRSSDNSKKHCFDDKHVNVHRRTNFVCYSDLANAVCDTNDDNVTGIYWDNILCKTSASNYMIKNNYLFISPNALNILVDFHKDSYKDSWGAFAADGFDLLLQDLKRLKQKRKSIEIKTEEEEEPPKKILRIPQEFAVLLGSRETNVVKNEKALIARHDTLEVREKAQIARENAVKTREDAVSSREKTMNEREDFFLEKERDIIERVMQYKENVDSLDERSKQLDERSKQLDDRSKQLDEREKDVEQFVEQTLSLAKQYTTPSRKKDTPSSTNKVHFDLPSHSSSSGE